MEEGGWQHLRGARWQREFPKAESMPLPSGVQVVRRIVRDAESRQLMDDQWLAPGVDMRRVMRSLRRPRNLSVEVEVSACDEQSTAGDDEPLSASEATQFRAVSARVNYVSMDRPDIQFCSKDISRCMASPVKGDWGKLKKLGRYLIHRPRVAHMYFWQSKPVGFTIYVDSNWAGCLKTRRSTTGIAVLYGNCLIRTLSRTQGNIALSSAEAELYAMVHAASEGLGAKAMSEDFGMCLRPFLHVDASAAIGIAQRKGLGKVRHLDTQCLWIQDALRERRLTLDKVKGTENPADMMTKPLESKALEYMMEKLNLKALDGRAAAAPHLTGNGVPVEG